MSHIVTISAEIRDATALTAACRRLGIPEPVLGKAKLFSGEAEGYCVQLRNWRYPVVCDVENGQVKLDDFNGRWGDQRELDRLTQAYSAEKAKSEARRRGHRVTEQSLADGSIKLTVHVGENS